MSSDYVRKQRENASAFIEGQNHEDSKIVKPTKKEDVISTITHQESVIAEQKKAIVLLITTIERIAKSNPHSFKTKECMFNELQGIANLANNTLNEIKL